MAKLYYEQDCDLNLLKDKTVAVIGYGSQGHAHALNLHESGVNVIVGLYEGSKSWKAAEDAGLKVMVTAEQLKQQILSCCWLMMKAGCPLPNQYCTIPHPRKVPSLCPWIQHPLRPNCTAGVCKCLYGSS